MPNEIIGYLEKFVHNWPLITLASSLVTFFIGLYAGHKTALLRDMRKEFNEAAEPLLDYFELIKFEAVNKQSYSTALLPVDNLSRIHRRLSKGNSDELRVILQSIIVYRKDGASKHRNEIIKAASRGCEIVALR